MIFAPDATPRPTHPRDGGSAPESDEAQSHPTTDDERRPAPQPRLTGEGISSEKDAARPRSHPTPIPDGAHRPASRLRPTQPCDGGSLSESDAAGSRSRPTPTAGSTPRPAPKPRCAREGISSESDAARSRSTPTAGSAGHPASRPCPARKGILSERSTSRFHPALPPAKGTAGRISSRRIAQPHRPSPGILSESDERRFRPMIDPTKIGAARSPRSRPIRPRSPVGAFCPNSATSGAPR